MPAEAVLARARELVARCAAELRLPPAYGAIRNVLEDPHGTPLQMCEALEMRPALASQLLALLSAPLHATLDGAWSIERAVNQLGLQRIVDLSLIALLPAALERLDDSLPRSGYWSLAVRCGLAARAISGACWRPERDRLLCAGVLMPLGLALMWHANPRAMGKLASRMPRGDVMPGEAQRLLMGTDHVAVTAALARHWQLPSPIQRALACSSEPVRAVPHHKEAAILNIAAGLAGFPGMPEKPDELSLDLLRLNPARLKCIATEVDDLSATYLPLIAGDAYLPWPASRPRPDVRSGP